MTFKLDLGPWEGEGYRGTVYVQPEIVVALTLSGVDSRRMGDGSGYRSAASFPTDGKPGHIKHPPAHNGD